MEIFRELEQDQKVIDRIAAAQREEDELQLNFLGGASPVDKIALRQFQITDIEWGTDAVPI